MLIHLLRQKGFSAQNASSTLSSEELLSLAVSSDVDVFCLSVVAPSTLIQARFVTSKLRARLREAKIVVGLWGATENPHSAVERLHSSGADEVVTSLAEAVVHVANFSGAVRDPPPPGEVPAKERREEVSRLHLSKARSDDTPASH